MEFVVEHLLLHLRPLHRRIARAVNRRAAVSADTMATGVNEPCVTDEDALLILGHLDRVMQSGSDPEHAEGLDAAELKMESILRARADQAGVKLPLDALAALGLDEDERLVLLACAALEIDSSYELIFGFIVDDLSRRFVSVELIGALLGDEPRRNLAVRQKLSAAGLLRRRGLVHCEEQGPTGRHHLLGLTPEAFAYLQSGRGSASTRFADRGHVQSRPGKGGVEADDATAALAQRLGQGVDAVGLWGPPTSDREQVLRRLAAANGRELRRLWGDPREALEIAWSLDALLWIDVDRVPDSQRAALVEALVEIPALVVLSGVAPWRPLPLLQGRSFAEQSLPEPKLEGRADLWRKAMPELSDPAAMKLAAKLKVEPERIAAAVKLARNAAAVHSNGVVHDPADHLGAAVAAVTRGLDGGFTTLIIPRRRADELILPATIHSAVLEVARFHRANALVGETWGMNRVLTGGGGVKALFAGEPGTGKTMAAEVIAHELGLPLLRVDLSRIASKWVGETERNLETAFSEAEASQAVLLFDEADSLFGKRGQVQKGSDRYANLEVSYLLQRLEDYSGIALLATNFRDNIDKAFTRRFDVVVTFPRPGTEERSSIWQNAFAAAPLGTDVDIEALGALDMTGAAIVSSARTAALVAADERQVISMHHVVKAVARQFQREARILTPRELGPFAALLESAS